MKATYKIFAIILAILLVAPAATAKKNAFVNRIDLPLEINTHNVSRRYTSLDYGLRIEVRSDVRADEVVGTSDLPSKEAANFPEVYLEGSLRDYTEMFLDKYATALGFNVGANPGSDFVLRVTIKDFRLRIREYNIKKKIGSSSAAMVVSWELLDDDRREVIPPTTSTGSAKSNKLENIFVPFYESYGLALGNIDWDRIASCLKIAKTAKQEKNKEVTGAGNTALEHTVIRWYIISSPQGADVSWRVVSSTPDVANTNANFVGTTPYESTESFDIRGLTYNNSGNVQIEVSCEKPGYLPQRKRFNLRQAIDQKEISAKFNLVKEDAE
ncbi:MAG: hypothetical protein K2F72_03940 [Muribaculaceae bacterium]|nr:hypothetical protein [Muribaculaceae bacterium]